METASCHERITLSACLVPHWGELEALLKDKTQGWHDLWVSQGEIDYEA